MGKASSTVTAERGAALIRAILDKCSRDGLDIKEVVTTQFDITPIYFDALKANRRPVHRLDESKLERIADWLGVSKGQVYMLAGILKAEDFYLYDDTNYHLNRIFREISSDPLWMGLAPSLEEWERLSVNTRIIFVHMYEQLAMKKLLQRVKEDDLPGAASSSREEKPGSPRFFCAM